MENAIPMNAVLLNILVWAGIVVLLILCLPFPRISKLILEICAFALRLMVLAVLVSGVYLWFRPDMVPTEMLDAYEGLPVQVQQSLPAPGTSLFGLSLAAMTILMYLPILAVLDVTRLLAGGRLNRIRRLTAPDVDLVEVESASDTTGTPTRRTRVVTVRSTNLTSAADRIASAKAAEKHNRVSDYVK